MLTEHGLKASQIPGTGKDGRLTAQDITRFVEARPASKPARGRATDSSHP